MILRSFLHLSILRASDLPEPFKSSSAQTFRAVGQRSGATSACRLYLVSGLYPEHSVGPIRA